MNWFENEEFWREFFPALFPAECFSQAEEQVSQILALTNCGGQSVLDLCCGPGRHALAFARRGFKVTGVDLSPYLLFRAQERASLLGVSVEWVMEDMRHFHTKNAFDLACNMTTSFGYFEDETENLSVLRNVWESLKSGGTFLIDTVGKEIFARKWQSVFSTDYSDGSVLLQRSQVRDDWCRVSNDWILLKKDRFHRFTYQHSIYAGRELKERLLAIGFEEVQLFGDLKGAPYGMDATRLIAVARK